MIQGAFRSRQMVRFGDVDHARMVYYPRYLNYFHVAFEEFWVDVMGMPYAHVMEKHRLGFPAVNLNVDFKERLRFGDAIEVEVHLEHVGNASIRWRHEVERERQSVGVGRITTVTVDMATLEKVRTPDWIRGPFEDYRKRCGDA